MVDTVVIAEDGQSDTGYRFSWGLAIAGGIAGAITSFAVLTLGAGVGLLLVARPAHGVTPGLLTGGGIYFLAAEAFGFAVGGHIAGRLLGPADENRAQEDFRAAAHGLLAWAIAVAATIVIMALAGVTATTTGAGIAALYGSQTQADRTAEYWADELLLPSAHRANGYTDQLARDDAARILAANASGAVDPADRQRLIDLTASEEPDSRAAATARVDAVLQAMQNEATRARRVTVHAALWLAFSLIFGAVVAMTSAVFARIEDDKEFGFRPRRG